MKIPAGMIIKQIIDEKRLKAKDVGDKMGISRQAVYQSYAKMILSDGEIERWSEALSVTKEDFLNRLTIGFPQDEPQDSSKSSGYLIEHLSVLEAEFKKFAEQSKAMAEQLQNQLAVKDRQIEKLMDLLGKPEDVIKLRASRSVMPLHGLEALFA